VTDARRTPPVCFPKIPYDYGALNYGNSDIMTSPYNPEITSAEDMLSPACGNKSLFIVFQPNNNSGNTTDKGDWDNTRPYYGSDNRQCIFEAGGPLSGFNMYIVNGNLCFGMWNRFEQKFMLYQGSTGTTPGIYPLTNDQIYLAQLEYHSTAAGTGNYRVIINDVTDLTNVITASSPVMPFKGLSVDGTDLTGIGGAARTCFHDYNTGETYSSHYNGLIGDVMLYNLPTTMYDDGNSAIEARFKTIYDFLNIKYNQIWSYPISPSMPAPKISEGTDGWLLFNNSNYDLSQVQISTAYPNPFADKTSFSVNLPEKSSNVTVALFTATGEKVKTIFSGPMGKGVSDFTIDGSGLTSGLYIFLVTGDNFSQHGEVILNK
jgi:hypothetical protein